MVIRDDAQRSCHDHIFRHVFTDPTHARDALAHIVDRQLAHRIDWSTLELVGTSFVDEHLRGSLCDALFKAKLVDSPHEALIYILWDHQSQPDRMMVLRLLEYAAQALRAYTKRLDKIPGYLPVLIPVLLYQGPGPWPGPFHLTDLHVIPGEPEPTSFIELHMVVCEIAELSHAALTAFALTAVRLMDMSARGTLDLASAEQVAQWIATVHDEYGYKAFMALVEYVRAAATEDGMVDAVIEHVKHEVRPRARCFFEERLAAELEPKLRAKERAHLLVRMLEHRFGELQAELRSRVHEADMQNLELWCLRLVSMATLDEIFAEAPPRRRSKRRRHRGKSRQPSPR